MGENEEKRDKVIVIGVDGATFDVIEPMVKKGELPNFERIMKNGCWGRLESTIPPLTVPAWPSFSTGGNPARHGLYEFMKRRRGEDYYGVVDASYMKGKTLWSVLSRHNKRCIILNVPFTYPPEKINGILISGSGTPDVQTDYTHPKELRDALNSDDYKPFITLKKNEEPEKWIETIYDVENKMKATATDFMKNEEWDFFMMVFMGVDKLGHRFWGHMDREHVRYNEELAKKYGSVIPDYYKYVDSFIGEILKNYKDSTIFIMSDHGMGRFKYRFRINNYLRENDLLEIKKGRERISIGSILRKMGITGDRLDKFFQKLRLKKVIRLIPEKHRRKIPYDEGISVREGDLDWSKTKVFSPAFCQVYINVKGRDVGGIVEEEDYDALRKRIYNQLKNLRYNKKAVIDRIHFKEEIYDGEFIVEAPDIVFTTTDEFESVDTITHGDIFEPLNEPFGHHRLEGIFLSHGDDIKNGYNIAGAKIYDIAPTLLHLMNIPIPKHMDGKVLKDIFKDKSEVKERKISYEEISEEARISSSIRLLRGKKRI